MAIRPKFLILVVDDDLLLVDVISRASKTSFPEATFIQVYSAIEAIAYIKNLDGHGPKLILLDIDLGSGLTGFALLEFLRVHPEARLLPILMQSVSQSLQDITTAYTIGAASFTTKPFSYEGWKDYLIQLRLYWVETVTLPPIRFHKQA